jgi:hypothetical protein
LTKYWLGYILGDVFWSPCWQVKSQSLRLKDRPRGAFFTVHTVKMSAMAAHLFFPNFFSLSFLSLFHCSEDAAAAGHVKNKSDFSRSAHRKFK